MPDKTIRIGTRGSQLALWQAEHVASLIHAAGYRTEIVTIETRGDALLDVTISKIGSKGVFTEEIEQQLLDRTIDIAVHSAKDLSSDLPEDLELLAFTAREVVNDVLVTAGKPINLTNDQVSIGTSSTRRTAFIRHFYPQVTVVPVRGNLQTRIGKMKAGDCDGLMLAYAGIHRMGFHDLIAEKMETSYFVPPAGQGSIAIECHQKLSYDKKEVIARWVNDPRTEVCVRAERSFLKTMQGGCSIPTFAYAHWEADWIVLKGGIISLDGTRVVKVKHSGTPEDPKALGKVVALDVLKNGGKEILEEIRHVSIPNQG